jgi:hypothetical protein
MTIKLLVLTLAALGVGGIAGAAVVAFVESARLVTAQ